MFCSSCGGKCVAKALFCHMCGTCLQSPTQTTQSSSTAPLSSNSSINSSSTQNTSRRSILNAPKGLAAGTGCPIMTFSTFQMKKESVRQSHFKPKSAKKQKTEVKVKIGVMSYRQEYVVS